MNKSTRTLLLIVGLLASPVVVASALYLSGWQPTGKPSGELLQPPRTLVTPLAANTEGRWLIVVAGAGSCDQTCVQLLDETRRIHVALYKQMPRVARLWLSDDQAAVLHDGTRLQQQQPDLVTADVSTANRKSFDMDSAGYRVYLMDPQGRLVLRYPADAPPKGILKDMERLLRYS